MKKRATIFLVTCLLFSLVACSPNVNSGQPSQTQTFAQTQEPTLPENDETDKETSATEGQTEEVPSENSSTEIYGEEAVSENVSVPFADGQPLAFLFASGAGSWGTSLTLYPDGSFEGVYENGENDAEPDYPRGTSYVCRFTGRFGEMTKLTDHAYSMKLEVLDYEEPGREWIEDGIRYISAEPYGLLDGEDFTLYVPETSAEELNEEFRSWWPDEYLWRAGTLQTLSCYGLFNTDTGQGFFTSHD